METIQVVLDSKLLQATDRAAQCTKRNRSALIRDALREHLRRLEIRTLEDRDRKGYAKQPRAHEEALVWEAEAAWPAEWPEEISVFTSLPLRTTRGRWSYSPATAPLTICPPSPWPPITSNIRGVRSEVVLSEEDGMKAPCAVNLHNAVTISQQRLGKRVARLGTLRMGEICAALRFSLGCDSPQG